MAYFLQETISNLQFAVKAGVETLDIALPQGLTDLVELFKGLFYLIGTVAALFGVLQIGMSISSHDASQRLQGFLALFGGVIIGSAPLIVDQIIK